MTVEIKGQIGKHGFYGQILKLADLQPDYRVLVFFQFQFDFRHIS
jgi:hypothetical protein